MTGSASVSAAMRNNFCISNILLVKFQLLLLQAEADLKITDVVQDRGYVAVCIVFRRRGAQQSNRAGRAQIFGLAPLLLAPFRFSSGVDGTRPDYGITLYYRSAQQGRSRSGDCWWYCCRSRRCR